MFKKLILNLHIYGGLLCFSYLIIFGISSLAFNHPAALAKTKSAPVTWEKSVDLPDLPRIEPQMSGAQRTATKAAANHAVRRALGLFGNQRPWQQSFWDDDDRNHYHASLVRPGKQYEVDVYLDRGMATVTERRDNVIAIIGALHGFHGTMPDLPLMTAWGWYTDFCTIVVLLAGISGVYLWTRRKSERRGGLLLIGVAASISMALILFIIFHG